VNSLALALAALRAKRSHGKKHTVFTEQDAFINDESQFVAAQCTRRAGKTSALALKFYKTMQRNPNSLSRYIALTRDSAQDIMWPVLQELNDIHGWNAEFLESKLIMELPNGARLRLFGADMKNFIKRLKGAKSPGIAIDEAQDFGPHLQSLIDDVLTPTILDYPGSWLAVTGTPGPIPRGVFYDICHEVGGYSLHKWSLYQNPYLPNAQEFVNRLKKKKEWPENHPTLMREYKNQWVLDTESLLIKYSEERNHYDALPSGQWTYILGVDLGYRDSDALAVLAWGPHTPNIYLVEEILTKGQDITQLSTQIEAMIKKYDIAKIVMDEGALGKKIAEEIRRRKHIPVQPAEKQRKMENVAFLNDWLRLGKFKARKDSRFAQDSYQVQIDYERTTPDRIILKRGFHSDIIDACLYGFKESPAFTFQAGKEKPKLGTPAWGKEQEDEMYNAALERHTALEEASKGFGWDEWA
jgi:hypothetical protein